MFQWSLKLIGSELPKDIMRMTTWRRDFTSWQLLFISSKQTHQKYVYVCERSGKFLCFHTCIASLINFPYNNDTSVMIDGMFVKTNLSLYSHVYHKTCGFILEVFYAINIENIFILCYSITQHSLIHFWAPCSSISRRS